MRRVIQVVAMAAVLATQGACVPVYKTLQPYAEAQVLDRQGNPVTDAEVVLISSAYPYGFEQFRTLNTTTGLGTATFYKVKDMRIEVMMLHGAQEFFWNWCIRKDGYKTLTTAYRSSDEFIPAAQFTLEPGASTACPAPRG